MNNKLPNLQDMMRQLVAVPSVSSVQPAHDQSNHAVSELLAGWLEPLGFSIEIRPVPGLAGKYNLVARSAPGDDGLVLSGHTDTVPFDANRWTRDPFAGEVQDGRLYGLGSADMKSFLAVAAHAAARVDLEKLARPLVIVGTADEESGMGGARALVDEGEPLGSRMVIGEPTALRPVTRHKGVLLERIRIDGRSGHASDPAAGLNAIDGAMVVIGALHALIDGLAEQFPGAAFPVPGPTLNIGAIRGGDNPNRICAGCELDVDLRLVPGMRCAETRAALRAAVSRALEGSGFELGFTALFDGIDPLAPGAHKDLAEACEHATGHACGAVNFGTEGPLFQQLDMDVVVCGPGDIAVAHQPDESIALTQAYRAVDVMEQVIRHFCSQAG